MERFHSLHAWELGKDVKVCVAGTQDKGMLQDEGCDPHVIRRDGSALFSQLPVHSTIVMRCLFVGVENAHTGLEQEPAENGFIARPLTADSESGT